METKVLKARVPLALAQKVNALAASIERSRDWVVKEAMVACVEQGERQHAFTL